MESRPLTPPILCFVTAGTSSPDLRAIQDAARAGVDLVQIRERELDDRSLLALVRGAIDGVAGTAARVVVNDRLDIALAAGADGVHLRGDSVAAGEVRRIAPPAFVIGRSVHDVPEAVAVERGGGCDYLVFGTVFHSAGKPGRRPAGVDALARVCAAVNLPVLAIGGVTVDNVEQVAAAGAAGIAAIGLFTRHEDIGETVLAARRAFGTCYPRAK